VRIKLKGAGREKGEQVGSTGGGSDGSWPKVKRRQPAN